MVAVPRNHRYLQQEIASFGRSLCIFSGAQHRRQIPLQFDLQGALTGRQDDGGDKAADREGGFGPRVRMLERPRKVSDLLPI